jgi:hypothetical protein
VESGWLSRMFCFAQLKDGKLLECWREKNGLNLTVSKAVIETLLCEILGRFDSCKQAFGVRGKGANLWLFNRVRGIMK